MKIISVVGARPNFMKIAPFIREINKHNASGKQPIVDHILVHTGQHYDQKMSDSFFKVLEIPEPDVNLGVGSGTHAEQVGQTMIAFEKVLVKENPDWVVVVGDVNATLACSVTAKKQLINCCHIEAGLRSGDMTMPEEINRLVTDRLSDLLLTPDKMSEQNLLREGTPEGKMRFVGNIMIDTLEANRSKANEQTIQEIIERNIIEGQVVREMNDDILKHYSVLTMHRPSNVDHIEVLVPMVDMIINKISVDTPVIWPVHPRAVKQLREFGLWGKVLAAKNILLLNPVDYLEMLRLNIDASVMITDSGGLQEECTVLGTPCLTLRWNTERPITLKQHGGVSVIVGNNVERILDEFRIALNSARVPQRPPLWDGHTASRCLKAIIDYKEK